MSAPELPQAAAPHDVASPGCARRLEIDWARYEAMLADESLTEDERRRFLEALWSILIVFVDLGFGLHPVDQACGQPGGKALAKLAPPADAMVSSDGQPSTRSPEAQPRDITVAGTDGVTRNTAQKGV